MQLLSPGNVITYTFNVRLSHFRGFHVDFLHLIHFVYIAYIAILQSGIVMVVVLFRLNSEVRNVPAGLDFESYILVQFTNERFLVYAIISGYLLPKAWALPVQS